MIPPLRLSFEVGCPADVAFDLWTARIDTWWPRDHTASGDAETTVVIEPHVGGRVYERTAAGREIDWGEVTAWDPPNRLAYLWHIRRDRSDATDVEIRFIAGDAGTVVEIEHSGWERLGDDGPARRDGNRAGWGALLPHFQTACRDAHS